MNDDRAQRRFGILVESFYRLKSLHLGKPVSPGRFDEQDLRVLVESQGASFVEVKQALRFVFVDDATKHWADELMDLTGFCAAYEAICDQVDGWFPLDAGTTATAKSASGGQWSAREGADHIRAQADTTSEDGFYQATGEERPSDDAREMYAPPPLESVPTGPAALRLALVESAATNDEDEPA